MFDLLKKKLGKFTEKLKERIEKKEAKPQAVSEKPLEKEKPVSEKPKEETASEKIEETASEKHVEKTGKPVSEEPKAIEEQAPIQEPAEEAKAIEEPEQVPGEKPAEEIETAEGEIEISDEEEPVQIKEEKRELKPRLGLGGKLKAAITGSVELKEADLKGLLWELELSLLEADVEQTTAEEICRKIKEGLTGKKLPGGKALEKAVKKEIAGILLGMMQVEKRDIVKEAREKKEKPYKILFLGPNGAGKTTSIAKLASLLQSNGLKVILAAGDTFRAASIEQLEKHAKNLNVRVVKHQYGADPAAVAFDAVKAAQSKKLDVVLIDSAGRQETNRNLMRELEKIVRVVQPDLKIYVGEAYTGQALLHQAKEYDKIVGIDGFILSKIDCDSKGGTTISLLYKIKKPILFMGTGQEYKDLEIFDPEFVLEKIIG